MTARDLALVLVRVMGIYLLLVAFQSLVQVVVWWSADLGATGDGSGAWQAWSGQSLLAAAVYGSAGLACLTHGARLASWLAAGTAGELSSPANATLETGLALLGTWFLVTGAAELLPLVVELLWRTGAPRRAMLGDWFDQVWRGGVSSAIWFGAGLFLVLRHARLHVRSEVRP